MSVKTASSGCFFLGALAAAPASSFGLGDGAGAGVGMGPSVHRARLSDRCGDEWRRRCCAEGVSGATLDADVLAGRETALSDESDAESVSSSAAAGPAAVEVEGAVAAAVTVAGGGP